MRGRWQTTAAIAFALVAVACGGEDTEAGSGTDGEGVEDSEEASPESEDDAAENPAEVRYEVQAGDTLSRIASDFGVSVSDIVEANELEDPDMLVEGQELVIPTP